MKRNGAKRLASKASERGRLRRLCRPEGATPAPIMIGLTGGFGSGKSTVTEILRDQGIPVIDADQIARRIVKPGTKTARLLRREFGDDFFLSNGSLDRQKMATTAFTKKNYLKKLNAIMHPPILREIERRLKRYRNQKHPFVVIDAALLMEVGMEAQMDATLVVWAPQKICIERLKRYRQISSAEARRRIRTQIPLHLKRKRADYVIDNSGTKSRTRKQTTQLIRRIQEDFGES